MISYKLKFIDSARFVVIYPPKEFIKLNASMDMIIKDVKNAELNTKIVSAISLFCYRNYQKKFDKDLKKQFVDIL